MVDPYKALTEDEKALLQELCEECNRMAMNKGVCVDMREIKGTIFFFPQFLNRI